jgi:hypothetical protein
MELFEILQSARKESRLGELELIEYFSNFIGGCFEVEMGLYNIEKQLVRTWSSSGNIQLLTGECEVNKESPRDELHFITANRAVCSYQIPIWFKDSYEGAVEFCFSTDSNDDVCGCGFQHMVLKLLKQHIIHKETVDRMKILEARQAQQQNESYNLLEKFNQVTSENLQKHQELEQGNQHLQKLTRDNIEQFHSLFESCPVPLAILDLSQVKIYCEAIINRSLITDLQTHLVAHQMQMEKCLSLIRFTNMNQHILSLFEVQSLGNLLLQEPERLFGRNCSSLAKMLYLLNDGNKQGSELDAINRQNSNEEKKEFRWYRFKEDWSMVALYILSPDTVL